MCFYLILLGLVFRWPFLVDAVREIQLYWMVSKKEVQKKKNKIIALSMPSDSNMKESTSYVCVVVEHSSQKCS